MSTVLPNVLNHFNVYNDAEKLIGLNAEVELPELTMINDTLNGSGVLGEIEEPVIGQYESMATTLKWTVLSEEYFSLIDSTKPVQLTLRGAVQCTDKETGRTKFEKLKIVLRGKAKSVNLGTAEKGKKMEAEMEIETVYIKVVINDKTLFELDKLNFKYVINGEDKFEPIRACI